VSDCACCRALLLSYVNSPEKIPGACEFVINALRYVQKNAPRYYKQTFSLIVSVPVFFINFRSVRLQFLWIYSVYVSFVNGLVVKVMDRYKFYSYLYEPWRSSSWSCYLTSHTHVYTFNGSLSGITRVSRYQKGKTNLDFNGARDSEWQWHQLRHMLVCTSLQTDNHASTPPLSFYRPDALPAAQPTASKHWRHLTWLGFKNIGTLVKVGMSMSLNMGRP